MLPSLRRTMKAAIFSETSMNFYQTIQLNIPDDILHIHRCEN
jgi:hypothetical protein